MFNDIIVIITQIRTYCRCMLLMGNPVSHRLCRVMGDPEGKDIQVSDLKMLICVDLMKKGRIQLSKRTAVSDSLHGPRRGIDGR